MLTLGIDPDSTDTAFAWWDDNGPVGAKVAHIPRRRGEGKGILLRCARAILEIDHIPGVKVACIEGQQFDSRRASKQSILTLARVSGFAVNFVEMRYSHCKLLVPTPREWTKGVAKSANQARLYTDLGWGYTLHGSSDARYAAPLTVREGFDNITNAQWKHVGDALLLAKWAHEQST